MSGGTAPSIDDPRTPAEAKRHWMIDRLWVSRLFSLVILVFLVGITWLAPWPTELAGQRLNIISMIALLLLVQQLLIDGYFALGGPVGRWKMQWGNRSFEGQDDDSAARAAYDAGLPR